MYGLNETTAAKLIDLANAGRISRVSPIPSIVWWYPENPWPTWALEVLCVTEDDAVPVEVDETETTPVPVEPMALIVARGLR